MIIPSQFPNMTAQPKHLVPRSGGFQPEILDIEGIVSGSSQPFSSRGSYILHYFTLEVWKKASQTEFENSPLDITRAAPPQANYQLKIPSHSVVKLSVYLNNNETRALLVTGEIDESPGAALRAMARSLAHTVTYENEVFGTISENKEFGWFEAQAPWNGRSTNVIFDPRPEGSVEKVIRSASEFWKAQTGWRQRIEAFAVEKLLPLKNERWLEEGPTKASLHG